jgi:hypothetical protein
MLLFYFLIYIDVYLLGYPYFYIVAIVFSVPIILLGLALGFHPWANVRQIETRLHTSYPFRSIWLLTDDHPVGATYGLKQLYKTKKVELGKLSKRYKRGEIDEKTYQELSSKILVSINNLDVKGAPLKDDLES